MGNYFLLSRCIIAAFLHNCHLDTDKLRLYFPQPLDAPVSLSIESFTRRALNEHILELFTEQFGLDPTLIKLNPNYKKLLDYGTLRA